MIIADVLGIKYYEGPMTVHCFKLLYSVVHISQIWPTRMKQLFMLLTNSFPVAAVVCYHGGFHVKWDILYKQS
jgi:hypothetical protein